MIRILALLLVLASSSFGAVDLTLNCSYGGTSFINKNTQLATTSSEKSIAVTVSPGHPVTIEFSNTQDWKDRSTTTDATTDKPVSASVPLRLRFTQTTTFYVIRSSADGVLVCTPLIVE